MERYRKKPEIVEAFQWFPGRPLGPIKYDEKKQTFYIETKIGLMTVNPGDWILTKVDSGDSYAVPPGTFAKKYELADQEAEELERSFRKMNDL